MIQEAVGCDLRGCRPEYDRLQARVQEVGGKSDAGHIQTKGCMAVCIGCMPGIET